MMEGVINWGLRRVGRKGRGIVKEIRVLLQGMKIWTESEKGTRGGGGKEGNGKG